MPKQINQLQSKFFIPAANIKRFCNIVLELDKETQSNWAVGMDDSGNINSISFKGKRLVNDDELFARIKPLVDKDSCIQLFEDGLLHVWEFGCQQSN